MTTSQKLMRPVKVAGRCQPAQSTEIASSQISLLFQIGKVPNMNSCPFTGAYRAHRLIRFPNDEPDISPASGHEPGGTTLACEHLDSGAYSADNHVVPVQLHFDPVIG